MCYTHGSTSLFPDRSAGLLRFRRTREASDLCKTLLEDNNLLNVCPVVEDEMDDDVMDDKEEPSEEYRPVSGDKAG